MEKTSTLVNSIYSGTTDYLHLQTKSVKLEIYERITNLISSGISGSFIILFGVFALLFINFGLAFWLSDILQSNKLGFMAVGGFYIVVLCIYLLLRNKIAKNKVKNAILLKVSKTHHDYDLLLKEQDIIHSQVNEKEKQIKQGFDVLKVNIDTLKEDLQKLKSHFITGEVKGEEGEEETVGPKLPRIAITSLIDLILQKVLFKNSGLIKKTLFPILANALATSTIFKEDKKTSFVENLKLKFSKFLG